MILISLCFQELVYALKVFNYFFTAVFILEAAMKIVALGLSRYLYDRWVSFPILLLLFCYIVIIVVFLRSLIIARELTVNLPTLSGLYSIKIKFHSPFTPSNEIKSKINGEWKSSSDLKHTLFGYQKLISWIFRKTQNGPEMLFFIFRPILFVGNWFVM